MSIEKIVKNKYKLDDPEVVTLFHLIKTRDTDSLMRMKEKDDYFGLFSSHLHDVGIILGKEKDQDSLDYVERICSEHRFTLPYRMGYLGYMYGLGFCGHKDDIKLFFEDGFAQYSYYIAGAVEAGRSELVKELAGQSQELIKIAIEKYAIVGDIKHIHELLQEVKSQKCKQSCLDAALENASNKCQLELLNNLLKQTKNIEPALKGMLWLKIYFSQPEKDFVNFLARIDHADFLSQFKNKLQADIKNKLQEGMNYQLNKNLKNFYHVVCQAEKIRTKMARLNITADQALALNNKTIHALTFFGKQIEEKSINHRALFTSIFKVAVGDKLNDHERVDLYNKAQTYLHTKKSG